MDGGQVVDIGDHQAEQESWRSHKLSLAEEARLEFDAEASSQLVAQAEAEQAEAQRQHEYAEALENYENRAPCCAIPAAMMVGSSKALPWDRDSRSMARTTCLERLLYAP